MEGFIFARVLHVLGVVAWIGGVAMVTTVLLPMVRRLDDPGERVDLFEDIERRFAWQARATTLIVGLSGLYMLEFLGAWTRYTQPQFWWLHLMTLVWVLFTLVLFVLEPLFLHRWFGRRSREDPEGTLRLVQRLHWVLLLLSLVAIAGGVAGSHGW
jgi:uncharacterized membrane protein